MSARLGEMLLKVGALTEADLKQVLSAQVIYGGRLGTNLVEMGLVGEDDLAHVLSEQLGVPCVEHQALDSIPNRLLGLIPLRMVQRYRVLPIALDGKRLTVAMANPSHFKALDEIGFITGMVIVPRVCPELRLSLALERCYGIKRPLRYIPVAGGIRSGHAEAAAQSDAHAAPREFDWVKGGRDVLAPERVTMKELADRLARASGEAEVVQAILSYLAGEFDRGAFLRLKHGTALGVQAVGVGTPVEGFARYAAAIDDSQQLKRVVEEKQLYLGELSAEGAEGALVSAMGGYAPAPALLMPLSLGGQVAAIICAYDLRGRLGGGVFELQRVAVMAELSLEMLSLKKRIMTG